MAMNWLVALFTFKVSLISSLFMSISEPLSWHVHVVANTYLCPKQSLCIHSYSSLQITFEMIKLHTHGPVIPKT